MKEMLMIILFMITMAICDALNKMHNFISF